MRGLDLEPQSATYARNALDLAEALRLEPNNAAVKVDLEKLRNSRPSTSQSPAPRRRRIPIKIVDEFSSPSAASSSTSQPTGRSAPSNTQKAKPSANKPAPKTTAPTIPKPSSNDSLLTPISSRPLNATPSTQPPSPPVPALTTVPAATPEPAPVARVGGGIFRASNSSASVVQVPPEPSRTPGAANGDPRSSRTAPTTLYEFSKEWNASGSTAEKWEIIRVSHTSFTLHLYVVAHPLYV